MNKSENSTYTTSSIKSVLTKKILDEVIERINQLSKPLFKYNTIIMNEYTRLEFKKLYGFEFIHGEKYSNATFYCSEGAPDDKLIQFNKPDIFKNY